MRRMSLPTPCISTACLPHVRSVSAACSMHFPCVFGRDDQDHVSNLSERFIFAAPGSTVHDMLDSTSSVLRTSVYEQPLGLPRAQTPPLDPPPLDPAPLLGSIRPAMWNDASWRQYAACKDLDTNVFFPLGNSDAPLRTTKLARSVCQSCPAQPACLEFALRTMQDHGIWGGRTEEERRIIRRARRAAARKARMIAG
jgi:WhiB family transcriptional regulator, redox-sensing transcriptional regulator